jgi:RNase P subunit RPR2
MRLKELMVLIEENAKETFEKGVKASAVRARKYLQEMKKLAQELRIELNELRKSN